MQNAHELALTFVLNFVAKIRFMILDFRMLILDFKILEP
ncbi:hypothetical protein NU08_0600 [Flavobacterium anhuiense]|uniref:Uncharacterized protein n=1 Tax=Flavobacterium anhuiense TaxID=459526 RepID=A0A444W252_9FLAO|nr:hypothetical protein NU08_0600 [Flavobacterium anhuiense]